MNGENRIADRVYTKGLECVCPPGVKFSQESGNAA